MSYVVLARKWRPQHFDEVVGQGHVARTLINSIEQDRVHHAYLFCGTRGVGKTTTARILAKALNCKEGPTGRPCYECDSCLEVSTGQSVDVFEIDGASNRGINEIRELRDGVRYAPSRDRNKVYIIDEVHMLTTEAFNALLKTLEEPPPHARFIFATTEPQKIPVTILSRCQRFDFKRIGLQDIVWHLQNLSAAEGIEADKAALQLVARQANGGMRDALSLLDQIISFAGNQISEEQVGEILGVANRKHLFEISEAVIQRDAEKALLVLDDVDRFGYDLQQFVSELVTHFRDLMVTATVKQPEQVTQLTESELEIAAGQVDGVPIELLHRYFSLMVETAQKMHRSPFPKLVFEMNLVRLAHLEPLTSLDLMVDRLALLEATLEDDANGEVNWPGGGMSDVGKKSEAGGTLAEVVAPVETRPQRDSVHPVGEERGDVVEGAEKTDELAEAGATGEKLDASEIGGDVQEVVEVDEADDAPSVDAPGERKSVSVEAGDDAEPRVVAVEAVASELQGEGEGDQEQEVEEVIPEIPQPLRPAETIEKPDVSGLRTPEDRWRVFVEYLRQKSAPVAAACEYAYVEQFSDGMVILRFDGEGMKELAGAEERRMVIEEGISELFGSRWEVKTRLQDESAPVKSKTLAQERQEDMERRREELETQVRENPAVVEAQEIFGTEELKVQVRLFDEH